MKPLEQAFRDERGAVLATLTRQLGGDLAARRGRRTRNVSVSSATVSARPVGSPAFEVYYDSKRLRPAEGLRRLAAVLPGPSQRRVGRHASL